MADVSVSLDLSAQQLYQELQNVQSHFAQFAAHAGAAGEKAKHNFSAGFTGLGSNVLGYLTGLGLGAEIKSVTEYGAKIQDLSDRFGVSTDALQLFGNAAEKNGSSLEAVAKGFRFLEVNQAKALSGNHAMVTSFAALGISIKDLETLRPETIAEKIGHSSLNAADFVKIFGKSAIELRPLLAGLADGTIHFGDAIDSLNIRQLKEANVAFTELKEKATILIGGGLAEFFRDVRFDVGILAADLRGLGIELNALAEAGALLKPDIHNLNPATALEKFKEIQSILTKAGADRDAAQKEGIGAAAKEDEERRLRSLLPKSGTRDFGDPRALGESEAGGSDDQGRPLSKGEAKKHEKEKEKEEAAKAHRFAGVDPSLALAILQGEQARADASGPIPGGRTAGVGESQAAVNQAERSRIAAEAQQVEGASGLTADFNAESRELNRAGELDGQLQSDIRAPTMEALLEEIRDNTADATANK